MSAYVSIRQHMSAYVNIRQSIRQHTSAYVSIRQHTSPGASTSPRPLPLFGSVSQSGAISIRQHTSAYASIRQHASVGVYHLIRQCEPVWRHDVVHLCDAARNVSICTVVLVKQVK